MPKRPIDYSAQIQARDKLRQQREAELLEEKKREEDLLDRQAKSLGQAVLAVFKSGMTVDNLTGLLHENLERLQANPKLEKEWTARGEAFFRPATPQRKQPNGTNGATGNGSPGNAHDRDGQPPTGAPALQPVRARTPAPSGTSDLLDSLAPHQTGQSTAAEGGSDDEHA